MNPPDLVVALRKNAMAYEDAHSGLLDRTTAQDEKGRQALTKQLGDLERERAAIEASIRQSSPRFSELQYPNPMDFSATKAALDPGTVLLSYAVGEHKSTLFAVSGGERQEGPKVYPLSVGGNDLRTSVNELRRLIEHNAGAQAYHPLAKKLYEQLINPAEEVIEPAQRILIIPDGPLHQLPFAVSSGANNIL